MPNWTSNRVSAEGAEADLRAFLEVVKWQDQLFDFNRITPMPEILRHTVSGSRDFDGKNVASWFVENPDGAWKDRIERPFTPEEEAVLRAIGHHDWYSWSVDNWGTKWNASRVDIDDTSIEYGLIEITFETAWDAPVLVLKKLFGMFPALTFRCEWRHEDESAYPHALTSEGRAA
jgi:hypothetical protein